MKRETNQVIWKTVVVAGAMLGTPACKSKPAPTTPTNTATPAPATPEASAKPDPTAPSTDPGDPCNAPDSPNRPRGADDDGGGGVGRGFVLS
jgi:hypothetical protein